MFYLSKIENKEGSNPKILGLEDFGWPKSWKICLPALDSSSAMSQWWTPYFMFYMENWSTNETPFPDLTTLLSLFKSSCTKNQANKEWRFTFSMF